MIAGRAPAVLFDMDGTLVDSNYLHIHAWARAFRDVGIDVDAWRIHRSIGMDGSRLVKELSGDADDDALQRLKDLHSRYYRDLCPLLRVLPGAATLWTVSRRWVCRWSTRHRHPTMSWRSFVECWIETTSSPR